jgi:hypothetical protein
MADKTTEQMFRELVAEDAPREEGCPDGGRCWHACAVTTVCFRVNYCAPLGGVYPENAWPESVVRAETPRGGR